MSQLTMFERNLLHDGIYAKNPTSDIFRWGDDKEKGYYTESYGRWLSSKDFTHFVTLTYRDSPWGEPPSFGWLKKSINFMQKFSNAYVSPMFAVVERGKNPPNMLGLSVPKGTKLSDVELREWESTVKGRLHLHGMMQAPEIYASFFSAEWERKYGWNKVVKISDKEKVTNYCMKYVMKELKNPEFIDNVHHIGDWRGLLFDGGDES